jgi:hypothetical protein
MNDRIEAWWATADETGWPVNCTCGADRTFVGDYVTYACGLEMTPHGVVVECAEAINNGE